MLCQLHSAHSDLNVMDHFSRGLLRVKLPIVFFRFKISEISANYYYWNFIDNKLSDFLVVCSENYFFNLLREFFENISSFC